MRINSVNDGDYFCFTLGHISENKCFVQNIIEYFRYAFIYGLI